MKVHLPRLGGTPSPESHPAAVFADLARFSTHEVTDDPADANLILFTDAHVVGDWRYSELRKHPFWVAFPEKCAVYDERDTPWAVAPGAYVSMPASSFQPDSQRAVGYYKLPRLRETSSAKRELLFSMMASPTHRSREPLFALAGDRGQVVRVDGFTFFEASSREFVNRKAAFEELLERSTFVLCPRGTGTSSIRMYEAMAAGCIPVVISDAWVPPYQISWDAAIIRWPEGVTTGLIDLLERRENEAAAMKAAGAKIYQTYLAPEVAFEHIVERATDALSTSHGVASPWRQRSYFDCGANAAYYGVRNRAVRVRDRLRNR